MSKRSTHLFHIVGVLLAMIIAMSPTVHADEMTTEETRAVMKEFLKYQHSGKKEDMDKWGAFYADDVEAHYHTTGPLGVYFFGREGFMDWYKKGAEAVNFETGMKVDLRALIVEGNVAVVRLRNRSRIMGAPYVQEYVHIYYWEDNKIVRMEGFVNGEASKATRDIARKLAGG